MQTTNKQSLTIDIRKRSLSSNFIEKTNVSQYIPQFVQGDTNILEAVIKDDGGDADLSNVGAIVANFKRQDRTVVSRQATKSGNTVTYRLGNEEMAKSGIGELELQFYNADDTERISTLRFKVNVMAEIGVGLEGEDGPTLVQELVFNGQYAKQAADSAITTWLSPVASYSAVTSIANPKHGDTVQTNDTGYVYRYENGSWKNTQQYGATALANVNAQLAEKASQDEVFLKAYGININDFDEPTRQTFLEAQGIDVNYVLGKGNVNPENTSFIYPSPENIYNFMTNTDGIRYGSTGAEVVDATYSSSDYISVKAGIYVIGFPDSTESVGLSRVPFYNTSKVFNSILSNGSTFSAGRTLEVTVPSDGYIKVSPILEDKHLLVVAKKENFNGYHEFSWVQEVKSKPLVGSVGKEELIDQSVGVEKTDFVSPGKNLFNKSDVNMNSFYTTAPATTEFEGYFTVKTPIWLKSNKSYTLQKVRQYAMLNLSGTTIEASNTNDNNATVTITTPGEEVLLYMSGEMSNLDNTQVEEGTVATEVESFGYQFPALGFTGDQLNDIKKSVTESSNESQLSPLKITKSGEYFTLESDFDSNQRIKMRTQRRSTRNNAFNFDYTEIGGVSVHSNTDDVAPIRTFATVGANHGYTTISIITMANHGKTMADLGSKWTDGTTTYTLLQINGNDLVFACPYTVDSNGIVSSVQVAPIANLTHVSGATNTSTVDVTTKNTGQLYPSINNISVEFMLDGKEITEDGTYFGEELQVQEHYNVMDYKAIIDYAQSNIGTSYANDSIAGVVKISNNYTFRKGLKCTTSHGLKALKKVYLGKCGFLQSFPMNVSGYSRKRFMPNVKVKSGYDFANGVDLNTYNTSLVFSAADYVDPAIPPSHYVDWLYDTGGNKKYGFSMGYVVDKTNSKNTDRIANAPNAWDMRNTTKSYPVAIEGKTLDVGDYLNFQGFRNYLSPSEVGASTSLNVVKDKKDTYVYAIFNSLVKGVNRELLEDIGKDITTIQSKDVTSVNTTVDVNGVMLNSNSSQSNGIFKVR